MCILTKYTSPNSFNLFELMFYNTYVSLLPNRSNRLIKRTNVINTSLFANVIKLKLLLSHNNNIVYSLKLIFYFNNQAY